MLPSVQSHDQKERRAGKPIFDVVVELEDGNQRRWSVVKRVAPAVDELLSTGRVAKSDIRTPLPTDGIIQEVHRLLGHEEDGEGPILAGLLCGIAFLPGG